MNHREKNFTNNRLRERIAAIDEDIDRYLAELDRADRQAAAIQKPTSTADAIMSEPIRIVRPNLKVQLPRSLVALLSLPFSYLMQIARHKSAAMYASS